eukprot:212799-Amphidinium_carterae.1
MEQQSLEYMTKCTMTSPFFTLQKKWSPQNIEGYSITYERKCKRSRKCREDLENAEQEQQQQL